MAPNLEVTKTLESLKDLEGVFGSFLVGENGAIVAQDLPSYFGSAAYDVAPRAQRFHEALTMIEGEVSYCIMRFGSHKLALRKIKGSLLTIVGSDDVNLPALRMAMNLVARKLAKVNWDSSESSGPPAPPTVRPPAEKSDSPKSDAPVRRTASLGAPEATTQPRPNKRAIYFRGKRVQ